MATKILRLILGDQLHIGHSWFQQTNDHITYVMMEVRSETDYARHHVQKVAGFFAAMRDFSHVLQTMGHRVIYLHLDDRNNMQSIPANITNLITRYNFTNFEYQWPDEYRLDLQLKDLCSSLGIICQACDSEHFFTERGELAQFFSGKKTTIMEGFYRYLRKKHHILMDGDLPHTGQWNYDADNRKKLPKNHEVVKPFACKNDVTAVVDMITEIGIQTIGTIDARHFLWPVNRKQSLELLDFFIQNCLSQFGDYQDAMASGAWSLYHSRLSFSMNLKMISPREVIEAAIGQWEKNPETIQFNQLEGFVRQILGWREYMRGLYWKEMPAFAQMNFFNNQKALPEWYWTGKTKMHCMQQAISQSLEFAYAHHIQRLMITGNFALLAGIHPDEVDAWYLGIYIDAIEWVEITNTRGMSQFADGGIVGTKPYVCSAAYIDKMSNHCSSCFYNKSVRTGDKACPFNSLYWHFFDKNAKLLSGNPRIGMAYQLWKKMDPATKSSLLEQANYYLQNINNL